MVFTYTGGGRASVRPHKDSITEVVVAEGVKDLPYEGGWGVFSWCGKMTEATLPSTLESIGVCAFYKCGQLREVDLSKTKVTTIGNSAFLECWEMTEATLPSTLESIGGRAFFNCGQLRVVDLSKTKVTTIGDYAFQACPLLQSVNLSPHTTELGRQAFCGCKVLSSLPLSPNVTKFGGNVFDNYTKLHELAGSSSQDAVIAYLRTQVSRRAKPFCIY